MFFVVLCSILAMLFCCVLFDCTSTSLTSFTFFCLNHIGDVFRFNNKVWLVFMYTIFTINVGWHRDRPMTSRLLAFQKLLYCYIVTLGLPSSDHRNLNGIETDLRNYGITDLRIYGFTEVIHLGGWKYNLWQKYLTKKCTLPQGVVLARETIGISARLCLCIKILRIIFKQNLFRVLRVIRGFFGVASQEIFGGNL